MLRQSELPPASLPSLGTASLFADLEKIIYPAVQQRDLNKLINLFNGGIQIHKITQNHCTVGTRIFAEVPRRVNVNGAYDRFAEWAYLRSSDRQRVLKQIQCHATFYYALINFLRNHQSFNRHNNELFDSSLDVLLKYEDKRVVFFNKLDYELAVIACARANRFQTINKYLIYYGEDSYTPSKFLVKNFVLAGCFEKATELLQQGASKMLAAEGYAFLGMEDAVKELVGDEITFIITYEYARGGHFDLVSPLLNMPGYNRNAALQGYIAGGYFHQIEILIEPCDITSANSKAQRDSLIWVAADAIIKTGCFDLTNKFAVIRILSHISDATIRLDLGKELYKETTHIMKSTIEVLTTDILPKANFFNELMRSKSLTYDKLQDIIVKMMNDKFITYDAAVELLHLPRECVNAFLVLLLQGRVQLDRNIILHIIAFLPIPKLEKIYDCDPSQVNTLSDVSINKFIFNLNAGHYLRPFFATLRADNKIFLSHHKILVKENVLMQSSLVQTPSIDIEDADRDDINKTQMRDYLESDTNFLYLSRQIQHRFFNRSHVLVVEKQDEVDEEKLLNGDFDCVSFYKHHGV